MWDNDRKDVMSQSVAADIKIEKRINTGNAQMWGRKNKDLF